MKLTLQKLKLALTLLISTLTMIAIVATTFLIFWPSMVLQFKLKGEITCNEDTHYCVQYKDSSWFLASK
jgi:ABC-type phosphate transport system auxiliary subunit